MGCLDSISLLVNQNNNRANYSIQPNVAYQNNEYKQNNIVQQEPEKEYHDVIYSYISEELNEEDYPLFQSNFNCDYIQNINKIYTSWLLNESDVTVIMTNKIYVTLNYKTNTMAGIEIEKVLYSTKPNEYKIKKYVYKGCSFGYMHNFIDSWNKSFKIDSSKWYDLNRTTDIIIKCEQKDDEINGFEMMYDKRAKILKYHIIENPDQNTPVENKQMEFEDYSYIIEKYNELNSDLTCEYYEVKWEKNSKPREWYPDPNKKKSSGGGSGGSSNIKYLRYDGNDGKDREGYVKSRLDGNYITNSDGYKRARINGEYIEGDGRTLKVGSDGRVRDGNDNYLGRVEDGRVYDADGYLIGKYDGGSKEQVAYDYFY